MKVWHIVTCEYPPQLGGVSDYVSLVARALAERGDSVHVWAPMVNGERPRHSGVRLHADFRTFSASELVRVGRQLDAFPGPRRLFVQWVPHGYARSSVNLTFCWWLLARARLKRDRIELMVHEPFLPFRWGAFRQSAAALAHRAMTMILLAAAAHVWYAIPAWEKRWRPYRFGRRISSGWLPLPSTVPVDVNSDLQRAIRARYLGGSRRLLGHFGTFGKEIRALVLQVISDLPADLTDYSVLLIGPGGELARDELIARRGDLVGRVHATGAMPVVEIPPFIAACDAMLQPYPDGVTTRRTSFMACIALGRPTITTSGAFTEEFWRASGAAVLAEASDPAALVRATSDVLADEALQARLSERARSLYEERFEPNRTIDRLRQTESALSP